METPEQDCERKGYRAAIGGSYGDRVHLADLSTPALVIDARALEHNLATMARARPGARLRPHGKAHKCTALAREQYRHGHHGFTCATVREVEGMVAAGLGDDLLLANEVVDPLRLRARMDHGNPTVEGGRLWFCSDEHTTFTPEHPVVAGQRITMIPAHIDPTMTLHERAHVVDADGNVLDVWPVDLRGW